MKNINIKNSIAKRLNLVILLTVFSGFLVLSALIAYRNYQSTTQKLSQKVERIIALSSLALVQPMWDYDDLSVKMISSAILQDEDLVGLQVGNAENPDKFLQIQEKEFSSIDGFLNNPNYIYREHDILRDNQTIGKIRAVISKKSAQNELETSLAWLGAIIAIVLVALIIFMAGTIDRLVKRPISTLKERAENLAAGNLDDPIHMDRLDELGVLARTFEQMRKAIKTQIDVINEHNQNLERKVAERTAALQEKTNDINAMLQHIPQGIFTVANQGIIHPEYSQYLGTIIGQQEISGRKIMDLIFAHSNLSADLKSQIDSMINLSIGENIINYETNNDLLPSEINFIDQNKKEKILQIEWAPIADSADIVIKILLAIRDVTELRALESKSKEQQQELDMIREILNLNPDTFTTAISTCENLLQKIFLKLETNILESSQNDEIFRHLHTIKGNARTFKLLGISNITHEAENENSKFKGKNWGKEEIILVKKICETVAAKVASYKKLYRDKIQRQENSGEVTHLKLKEMIQTLLANSNNNFPKEFKESLDDMIEQISGHGSKKATYIFSQLTKNTSDIAQSLDKESPRIITNIEDIILSDEEISLIEKIFPHLINNSIDHGIESKENRLAANKNPEGTLFINLYLKDGKICFDFTDDGQGLNLNSLRKIGLEMGRVTANDDDHSVAKQIFVSGLSTNLGISEFSGRGVGLDSVASYLRDCRGTITIELVGNKDKKTGRQGFILHFQFPRLK